MNHNHQNHKDVHTCMCASMRMVHVHVWAPLHARWGQRVSCVSYHSLPYYPLRQGLLLNLEFTVFDKVRTAGSKAQHPHWG